MRACILVLLGSLSACFTADRFVQRGTRGASCMPDGSCSAGLVCDRDRCFAACGTNADCVSGETCAAGLCVTNVLSGDACDPACAPGQDCINGRCTCTGNCPGCCAADVCVLTSSVEACGTNGRACTVCAGLTPTCSDDGICTAECDASISCGGGCCAGTTCEAGTTTSACGNNGAACVSCASHPDGAKCVAGQCGCETEQDCGALQACVSGKCSSSCAAATPCKDGCCDASGVCRAGLANDACGPSGSACEDCNAASSNGRVCLPGSKTCGCSLPEHCAAIDAGADCVDTLCGCDAQGDCPSSFVCGNAGGRDRCLAVPCDGVTPTCTSSCCGTGNVCQGTPTGSACGTNGLACVDCTGNAAGASCVNGACGCTSAGECATSTRGHDCVSSVCGCDDASDCPTGEACDLTTHTCSSACGAGKTACNGGCCLSASTCVVGTQLGACGGNGGACVNCAVDTAPNPDCTNAAPCTCDRDLAGGTCGHSGCDDLDACQGGGVCHDGSCLQTCSGNADGPTAITSSNPDHCGCTNDGECASSPNGTQCRADDRCGCDSAADCAVGSVCNTTTHRCVAGGACASGECHGCCASGTGLCVGGRSPSACGEGVGTNATCTSCAASADGTTCNSVADGGVCGCASGADCTTSTNGSACRTADDDKCGCDTAFDCDPGERCNTVTHRCLPGGVCDATNVCNGCCDPDMGICGVGNGDTFCGVGDGLTNVTCNDCTAQSENTACIAATRTCGCTSRTQCNPGHVCNTQANLCLEQSCDTSQDCNGCCVGTLNGACDPGFGNNACGASASGNVVCDVCTSGETCNDATRTCGATGCGIAGPVGVSGTDSDPCVDGCCNGGTCISGTANANCGNNGLTCANCASDTTPAPDCSAANPCTCNDTAGGGICSHTGCSASDTCASGSCELSSGTCRQSCAGSPDGTLSIGGHCGCNNAVQCPAGQRCNVSTNVCTSGAPGPCSATLQCNGCCSTGLDTGTCNPGNMWNACGTSGQQCGTCAAGGVCLSTTRSCDNLALCTAGSCNGCCNDANNDCISGTADTLCLDGPVGPTNNVTCTDCTTQSSNKDCLLNGSSVNICGCDTAADCTCTVGTPACIGANAQCTCL